MNNGNAGGAAVATAPVRTRTRRFYWNAWGPVVFCVLVICLESTPWFGADHTSGPLKLFVEFLKHRRYTASEWWKIHMVIRKCGHFLGYGLLSISWFRAFWLTLRSPSGLPQRRFACHGLAMLGTLLVASGDETHQLFLPNRTGSIVDVGIDCSGGLLMQLLLWSCMSLIFWNRSGRAR